MFPMFPVGKALVSDCSKSRTQHVSDVSSHERNMFSMFPVGHVLVSNVSSQERNMFPMFLVGQALVSDVSSW